MSLPEQRPILRLGSAVDPCGHDHQKEAQWVIGLYYSAAFDVIK